MKKGLTYNDVLLIPKRTSLKSRKESDIKTLFTKNIPLNIPLISSNMATVTEHEMAIAMARAGGLGVIHQFSTIQDQVEEIKKVKKSTSYIIEKPLTIQSYYSLKEAIEIMERFGVTSLIVLQGEELGGILTRRDYLFMDENKKISEIMTPKEKLITAPKGISLEEAKTILQKNKIEKLPLTEDGKLAGLITITDIEKLEHWPDANRDLKGSLRVGAAVGVKDTLERVSSLVQAGADVIILDIAHCHSDLAIQRIREIKQSFSIDLMAGNIATSEAALDLIQAGADGLKVGIGPSAVCTTRIISGSGIPQLTAIMDVVKVAKEHNIPVCADGGAKYPGDLSKAIAAGASSVFSGSFFAGTKETPGRIIMKNGKRFKRYMGSASYDSNHERKEKLEKKTYKENINVFVEGVAILVDFKGPVEGVIGSLIKGLRSGISYCGGRNIKEMQENAEFIQITPSGWKESQSRGEQLSE
ncbi:IMP dehydrogenase [archaeon]|jgi:IMP dehydrogenase|nr:IMP dehydrogenase [archaeon]MBT3730567.1 IMP dehydrogenase [archaeon]MBT4669469.1 IMP dehydrogenase [archaeon]MBT5030226.1 IMP dehydrogenase [archaeon]MBT5287675.1 IMP dehydrogenase [archaeon]